VITLDLPCPPSVNRLRRLDKAGLWRLDRWRENADNMITAQWATAKFRGKLKPTLVGYPVSITVKLSENERLDLDNVSKALLDYLKRIEIISDDSKRFVRRLLLEWVAPEEAPDGVRVTISSVSPPQLSPKS
jgi:Holliday junction resolvase RusA-like endonuclease